MATGGNETDFPARWCRKLNRSYSETFTDTFSFIW